MNSTIKTIVSAVTAFAVVTTAFASNSFAQESEGGVVAVLDVARVFKENMQFDSAMKAIKREADQLKQQIQTQQEQIKQAAVEVSQLDAGTQQRNNMEAKVEQDQAALRTRARQAEADLLNREAKIYYDTYQKVQSVVAELAATNNISLVLRFDGESIDPTNRADVIKGVNRAVIYHSRIDLTKFVIDAMAPATAAAPNGNQPR